MTLIFSLDYSPQCLTRDLEGVHEKWCTLASFKSSNQSARNITFYMHLFYTVWLDFFFLCSYKVLITLVFYREGKNIYLKVLIEFSNILLLFFLLKCCIYSAWKLILSSKYFGRIKHLIHKEQVLILEKTTMMIIIVCKMVIMLSPGWP